MRTNTTYRQKYKHATYTCNLIYTMFLTPFTFFLDIFPKIGGGGGGRWQLCKNPFSIFGDFQNLMSLPSSIKHHDLPNKMSSRSNWNLEFLMPLYFLLPRCLRECAAFGRNSEARNVNADPQMKKCVVKFVSVRNLVAGNRKESRDRLTEM